MLDISQTPGVLVFTLELQTNKVNAMDDEQIVRELHEKILGLRDELHDHASQTEEPKCAALCETSAEVLGGLETAFDHFINQSEEAWR